MKLQSQHILGKVNIEDKMQNIFNIGPTYVKTVLLYDKRSLIFILNFKTFLNIERFKQLDSFVRWLHRYSSFGIS